MLDKLLPFRRFDPRLKAELHAQRKMILLGLFCVAVSSGLQLATVPLISSCLNAINEAAPLAHSQAEFRRKELEALDHRADVIAPKLGVPKKLVEGAFEQIQPQLHDATDASTAQLVAPRIGRTPEQVLGALNTTSNLPQGSTQAVNRLGIFGILVVCVYATRYWFVRGQTLFLSMAAARMAADLRIRMFAKLQRLPVTYFNEKRSGAIQSVLTNDVNVYQNAVTIIRDSVEAPVKAVGALAFIIYYQWQLAIVCMIFLPLMGIVIQRNAKKMRIEQAHVQSSLSSLTAMSVESLLGARIIRAFGAEGSFNGTFRRLVDFSYDRQVVATTVTARLRPLVELIGAFALATVLYICGWLAYSGTLQLGQVGAIMYALDVVNQGVRGFGNISNTHGQVQAASDRIYSEILDAPEPADADGGTVLDSPQGHIEFRGVSFSYPDGTEALRNVSFTLEPGTSLALVGPSGAGKSTIADLVLRFYEPTSGQIFFDGVDVTSLNRQWLRQQIGVVPQQTFLFAGTVEDNIRMGKPDATSAEIDDAAAAAHATEFVATMDRGLATELGETGIRLSGGQRQRVAIARALVRKPTMLLLDEATSALDPESERVVTEALNQIMHTRTTLFIAHRLTTAARADRILVMRRGEVVESGSHADLMAMGGAYAGLFQAFSGGVLG